MSLNPSAPASSIYTQYNQLIHTGLSNRAAFASVWDSSYLAYGNAGVVPIATGPATAGIIYSGIMSLVTYQEENITRLAQMFSDYWATSHLIPVSPAVSIIGNDALTKVSDFEDAIRNSYRYIDTKPYYRHLIQNVEDVVKTIIWTGLDSSGSTITGTIS